MGSPKRPESGLWPHTSCVSERAARCTDFCLCSAQKVRMRLPEESGARPTGKLLRPRPRAPSVLWIAEATAAPCARTPARHDAGGRGEGLATPSQPTAQRSLARPTHPGTMRAIAFRNPPNVRLPSPGPEQAPARPLASKESCPTQRHHPPPCPGEPCNVKTVSIGAPDTHPGLASVCLLFSQGRELAG